jgi:hypothetical protein
MITLLIIVLILPALLLVPAWASARRKGESWWFLFFHGPAIFSWVLLTALGYGAQSLSNLMELLFLAAAAVVIGYFKVFVVDRSMTSPNLSTLAAAGLLLAVALALRSLMPVLPE